MAQDPGDFHRYEWRVVFPKPGYWKASTKRMFFIGPVALLLMGGAYYISANQTYFKIYELMGVFTFFILSSAGLANSIWHNLSKNILPEFHKYEINKDGLVIDGDDPITISWSSAYSKLQSLEVPRNQWPEVRPDYPLELSFPTSNGSKKLFFPEESNRQKFIQSVKAYANG